MINMKEEAQISWFMMFPGRPLEARGMPQTGVIPTGAVSGVSNKNPAVVSWDNASESGWARTGLDTCL
jgi:hypothetical protein